MKNLYGKSILSILLVLTVIFTSCLKRPETESLLPINSTYVILAKPINLLDKIGMTEYEKTNSHKAIKSEILKRNSKLIGLYNDIIMNPMSTGVSFKKTMAAFGFNEKKDFYSGLIIPLEDISKFETFIERFFTLDNMIFDVNRESNYSFLNAKSDYVVGWNEDHIVILYPLNKTSKEYMEVALDNIFNGKEEEKLTSNSEFKNFFIQQNDVSFWINSNLFLTNNRYKDFQEKTSMGLKNNILEGFVSLEKEDILLNLNIHFNEDFQKLMDNYPVFNNTIMATGKEQLSDANTGILNFSLNIENLNKVIAKFLLDDDVNQFFNKYFGTDFDRLSKNLVGNFSVGFQDFFIKDRTIITTEKVWVDEGYDSETDRWIPSGYQLKEVPKVLHYLSPSFNMYFNIEDEKLFDKVIGQNPDKYNKILNYYSYNNGNESFYFIYDDMFTFVSQNENQVLNYVTTSDFDPDNYFSNKETGMGLNLFLHNKLRDLSDEKKDEIMQSLSSEELMVFNFIYNHLEEIDFSVTDQQNLIWNIKLFSNDNNGFRLLFNEFDKYIKVD